MLAMYAIVTYDLGKKSSIQKTRIVRVLFGFEDKSNFGKYAYVRPGFLDKIPGARHIKSGILVEKKQVNSVIRELRRLKIRPEVTYLP